MKAPTRSASIPIVQSVVNALRVVEALARSQPRSAAELGRVVELPKSSVFRALITLESEGWAQCSSAPAAEWSLTNRVFELGLLAFGNSAPLNAVAALAHLRDKYHETSSLLVPSGEELVVVAREDGTNPLRSYIALGTRVSLSSTASGRAYLSALPPGQARNLLRRQIETEYREAESYEQRVWQEVQRSTDRGYSIDDGSADPLGRRPAIVVDQTSPDSSTRDGVAGVAAPIVTPAGLAEGVITITMPSSVASAMNLDTIGLHLSEVCARLGASRV